MDRVRHARVTCGLLALALLVAARARAEHGHEPRERPGAAASRLEAGLGVVAASYRSPLYEGSYQGGVATAGWARKRFGFSAAGSFYRIERNGKADHGLGDAMLHGVVALLERPTISLGAIAMLMIPTGRATLGLGMGT